MVIGGIEAVTWNIEVVLGGNRWYLLAHGNYIIISIWRASETLSGVTNGNQIYIHGTCKTL